MALPTCGNCERKIGHLEERFEYRGAKVCRECYQRLTGAAEIDPPPAPGSPARGEPDPPVREDDLPPIAPPSAEDAALDAIIDESTGYPCAACHQHFSVGDLTDTPDGWLCPGCAAARAESAAEELTFDPTVLPGNVPARPRGLERKPIKKKKPNVLVIVLVNGLLAGGAIYLIASGKLRQLNHAKPPETVVTVQTSEDSEAVNRAIRESNDLVAARQYDQARQTLTAARDQVQSHNDPLARDRLPELEDAIGKLDRLISPGAATRPADRNASVFNDSASANRPPGGASPTSATRPSDSPAVAANSPAAPATQPGTPIVAAPVVPSIVPPAAPPADPNDPRVMRATAWDTLVGGNFADAAEQFQTLLKALPQDRDGELGLAISQIHFGDTALTKAALATIERIHVDTPDTSSVIGLASVTLDDNPIRSAKLLADYLDKYNVGNEVVLNALGTSLVQCDRRNLATPAVIGFQATYFRNEALLEQAMNNGKKRFGAKWFDADDADQKWADYRAALDRLNTYRNNAARAAANFARVQQQKADAMNSRRGDPAALDSAVNDAKDAADHEQKKLDTAKKNYDNLAKPTWPETIQFVRPVAAVIR